VKIPPSVLSWLLIPFRCLVRRRVHVAFHHEDFNRSSFWSSSFFALEGLIVSLAGYELISGSVKKSNCRRLNG